MSFQLSQEQSNNNSYQIFFTQHSELEDRLDPLFYIAIQNIKKNILEKAKYQCVDLIKTCSINRGRFGHRPRNDPKFYGGEYPFIQTGDIVQASFNNTSIKYTQTLNELGLKTSKLFKPPQLLFTIAANIGDTAILDFESCFPDSIVSLVPKNTDISIEYLNYYLKLIKPYVIELAPYSAQRNLNNQQLAQVPIIVPPKETQKELVSMMDKAYLLKKQKEAQAQQLLDSIDDYLLGELGIKLPKQEENTLKNRIFRRQLCEVSGKRLDPDYYQIHYQNLIDAITKSTFGASPLYEATDLISNGNTPASSDYADSQTKYPIIKVKSYKGAFISLDKLDYTKEIKIQMVKKNDIFVLSAAHQPSYVGRFLKFLDQDPVKNTSFVGELICIRANQDVCHPMYLFSMLNMEVYKVLLNREKTGQTSHIYPKDIKHIQVPLPPIETQTEIANKITKIRQQAKQLQQEAIVDLEQAKKEVEAMILGEA